MSDIRGSYAWFTCLRRGVLGTPRHMNLFELAFPSWCHNSSVIICVLNLLEFLLPLFASGFRFLRGINGTRALLWLFALALTAENYCKRRGPRGGYRYFPSKEFCLTLHCLLLEVLCHSELLPSQHQLLIA